MGWCTTSDPDRFTAVTGGFLGARAAENSLLLSAACDARIGWHAQLTGQPPGGQGEAGAGLLFGWWEPPDGSGPRAAFLHDPAVPLLIAGRAPEMAAALAGTLARMGRTVSGVDGPTAATDAFAAVWSQRAGAPVRVHRHCRIYRLSAASMAPGAGPMAGAGAGVDAWRPLGSATPSGLSGPAGRVRVATAADRGLLTDWLTAYASEAGERMGPPRDVAEDLISYGGAVFWETAQRSSRLRDAAHLLVGAHHRDSAQHAEHGYQPVAMAALTRPVAQIARISMVYTPPERRRNGYAVAVTLAASRAALTGIVPCRPGGGPGAEPLAAEGGGPDSAGHGDCHGDCDGAGQAPAPAAVTEVVLITERSRPDRQLTRLGYQLAGERTVLRFGPPTGPMPRLRATGPMPRLPTGPLPRLPRLHR